MTVALRGGIVGQAFRLRLERERVGSNMDLSRIPVTLLVDECRSETARYRHGEQSDYASCYELFRRAICDGSQPAWEAVVGQYRNLVLAWVRRHGRALAVREEDDYWVNRTFERFWMAVRPDRFGTFPTVAALMRYLWLCVHSVMGDEARAVAAAGGEEVHGEAIEWSEAAVPRAASGPASNPEAAALGAEAESELWRAISGTCNDDTERLVVYESFALGLRPQEICERHAARFPSIAEVYRVKRNVVARLRLSEEIRSFLP